jgi:hypothetical protein
VAVEVLEEILLVRLVLLVAVVMEDIQVLVALETPLLLHPLKVLLAELALVRADTQVVVVAVQLPQVVLLLVALAVQAAQEPHQALLALLQLTLAVEVVAPKLLLVLAVLVAVAMVVDQPHVQQMDFPARLELVVAVVVG